MKSFILTTYLIILSNSKTSRLGIFRRCEAPQKLGDRTTPVATYLFIGSSEKNLKRAQISMDVS